MAIWNQEDSANDRNSALSSWVGRATRLFAGFAARPGDVGDIRSQKLAILVVAGSCSIAGLAWFAIYIPVFGWQLPTFLPLLFTLIVGSALLLAHRIGSHQIAVYAQIVSIIGITFGIQWTVGGLFDSGLVMLWALVGPLVALMFLSTRHATIWFGVFVAGIITTVILEPGLSEQTLETSAATRQTLFALNVCVMSLVVFAFTGYYIRASVKGRAAADLLLFNVLPSRIAEDLKEYGTTPAQSFDSVSVVFADVVGSTSIFAGMKANDVVEWLNEVFTVLDTCVARFGLEKLHTAGDGYMAAAGVPEPRPDHARAAVACGLEMAEAVRGIPARSGNKLYFRFGVNSGPVVAGVIGTHKFRYDIWGDTVNVASRMESTAEPGRIHISEATYELVKNDFTFEQRGQVEIKGKGPMRTWYATGVSARV